jgi:cytochrome c-type biogenesis protein CcmF
MIVELGHLSLILALMVSVATILFSFEGARRGHLASLALSPKLSIVQFLLVSISFAALTYAYVTSDFSVLNVALHSHTEKPLIYKISGVWGNHEGSLLFWALVLTLYGAAVAVFGKSLTSSFKARALGFQSIVTSGFLLFMITTSNPFIRITPPALEGNGLNPLLQDPALAFHPPLLYLGYVGLAVVFSFSLAALVEGRVDKRWASWVRPWALLAWGLLTGGIALGSWWAYYELGWGGWWFWDPVENASFMPWLAGTALIHSVAVVEKREALKSWTVLLAILAFSLSLIGTFIVRSGVLTSVHAFAVDPERGVFILGFLAFVIGGSLTIFALRANLLKPKGSFEIVSREGSLVFNNLFMVTTLFTVFLGTLYPLFVDALAGEKLSVGAPYFEATFVPLFIPILFAMVLGPILAWKKASLKSALANLKYVAIASVAFVGLIAWMTATYEFLALLGLGLGLWVLFGVFWSVADSISLGRVSIVSSYNRLRGFTYGRVGMFVAHLGIGITVLGIAVSTTWSDETLANLKVGEGADVGAYHFRLDGLRPVAGPNYSAVRAYFSVSKIDGVEEHITVLMPEERTFWSPATQTTEVAIYSMLKGDLYAVIGNETEGGRWSARLYFKPLITWIWFGGIFMMFGAFISMFDRSARKNNIKDKE